MKYTESKTKELVTLRKRKMKDGGYSLLLDYMIDGVRTRENLKMYLVPERTRIDRAQNQATLASANAAKARRIIQIQEGSVGIRRRGKDVLLTDYLVQQQEEYAKLGKPVYVETLGKIVRRLKKYGKKTSLHTVDKEYILGFVKYLRDSGLAEGTVLMYFSNLNTIFNNAYKDGLMQENPISRIETRLRPKRHDATREYLTLDEVRLLAATPCRHPEVKKAFLFACFTGLRLSDIEALDWTKIRRTASGWQVEARQIKTKNLVYIPLSQNAIDQISPFKASGKVFGLPGRMQIRYHLSRWTEMAGITKHITFHCSRHTNATLLLTYGADLYMVSKILGHRNIATTQIYARIVDETKRTAVDNIPAL